MDIGVDMFNHKEHNIFKAIGVDVDEFTNKVKEIALRCEREKKVPSEKIEILCSELSNLELATLIYFLEDRISKMKLTHTDGSQNTY